MPQKKILLVQLFSYGDCLYATAIARQIKKDYPGCYLVWAIASFCKDILDDNPFVDEVMEVATVRKSNTAEFRRFKKEVYRKNGFDEIFVTTNMDYNQAYYDGCIRSNIFNAYPNPVTVPIQPVVRIDNLEHKKVKDFAEKHELNSYINVILFEYAPQSGQSMMSKDFALHIAEELTVDGKTAVILSSANKIDHPNKAIIDGSVLNFRETIAFTHYCTFLLGSSSGITWASTSDAGKQLPMVQLLNAGTTWVNPISRDFKRFGFSTENVIELIDFNAEKIIECVQTALKGFSAAKKAFNQDVPLHFKTTRKIVYNLLVYLEFGAILKHIKYNRKVYGNNESFFKEVMLAFILFPFKLIGNLIRNGLLKIE